MCGIAGFVRYPTKVEDRVVHTVMSILFPRIMLEVEERGTDATGIYQVHGNGDWMMAKCGRKASEWIVHSLTRSDSDPILFEDFLHTWDQHPLPPKAVIGHCRKATIGSLGADNRDNHPFAIQLDQTNAILGVHNGTLSNHERIFQRLDQLGSPLERQGEVDSEALMHLLYHTSDGGSRPWTLTDLYSICRKVEGSYALVAMNSRFPEHLVVMRDGRPLEVVFINPLGIAILCSDDKYVKRAVAAYELLRRFSGENLGLPEITIQSRVIQDRTCRIFDLTKTLPATLEYKTLDDLTIGRDLNPFSVVLPDEEWRKPTVVTPATVTTPAFSPYPKGGAVMGPTTKVPPPKDDKTVEIEVKNVVPAKVKAEITIPPETLTAEEAAAKVVIQTGRFIDLCPVFTTKVQLAAALGVSTTILDQLVFPSQNLEMFSRVAELGFLQGYAMGSLDNEKEISRIRVAGRAQGEKLENATTQLKKARKDAWETRTLVTSVCVLAEYGIDVTAENLRPIVEELCQQDKVQAERILTGFTTLMGTKRLEAIRHMFREEETGEQESL